MTHAILGLDIGGANLKAYHTDGLTLHVPFPLWQKPGELRTQLANLQAKLPIAEVIAVTMTGELCDCFESKRAGVNAILDAVEDVSPRRPVASVRASVGVNAILDAVEDANGARPVRVWRNDGRFVSLEEARATALQVAAANWLALATFAGCFVPTGPALLFDIGTTTADLIPLWDGLPVPRGRTDPERLRTRELVYTGVRRTPLCALLGERVTAEVFATTLDVYLVLGLITESDERDTADGREATRPAAEARLARMLGADLETSQPHERRQLAVEAAARQVVILVEALRHVTATWHRPLHVVIAGEGEFLARRVLATPHVPGSTILSLTQELGPQISHAACAYAVATLAREEVA